MANTRSSIVAHSTQRLRSVFPIRIVLNEPVVVGFPRSNPKREIAEVDPLAKALFEVGHVVSVFTQDKILTITKDAELTWNDLLPRLAPPIRSAPSAQEAADGRGLEIVVITV